MSAPARAIDRRREQTRGEILDAAWELCRQDGLVALSLRNLAERVGMRAPSLYAIAEEVLQSAGRAMAAAGVSEPRLLDLWTALLTGLTDQQISNDPGGDRWYRLLISRRVKAPSPTCGGGYPQLRAKSTRWRDVPRSARFVPSDP
ncbi:MAG: TetR family transcriptional regulator [Acidimicrobiales bacterium]|nr:TetR family transcriptional regulator [Acidimicrobiales bacterium]